MSHRGSPDDSHPVIAGWMLIHPSPAISMVDLPAENHLTSPGRVERYGKVSENVGVCWVNIPNEIAIFHRDNDQQNHWAFWGTQHFQTHPY